MTSEPHESHVSLSAEPAAGVSLPGEPTAVRNWVLVSLCLAAIIAYSFRQVIAVAKESIESDLKLSAEDMGGILSAFYLSYAVFQVPAGWVGDRWGSRAPLALFMLGSAAATAAMALGGGFWTMAAAWLIGGAAQAGLFPCAAKTVADWLPKANRSFASGALGGAMSAGAAGAAALTGSLLHVGIGWRWVVAAAVLPGIIWSAVFYRWFRDRPEEHAGVNAAELALIAAGRSGQGAQGSSSPPDATPWESMMTTSTLWFICGQQFFRAAGYVFFLSWFSTYLQEAKQLSIGAAGWLNSLPVLAVVVGSPFAGWLSDQLLAATQSRRIARQGLATASLLACAALVLPVCWIHEPLAVVLVITAGSFCASFGGSVSYATTMDLGGRHVSTVFSIMNMCGNLGAALFPLAVPYVRAATGNWDAVLFMFAGFYLGAALCWLGVDPNATIEKTRELPVKQCS